MFKKIILYIWCKNNTAPFWETYLSNTSNTCNELFFFLLNYYTVIAFSDLIKQEIHCYSNFYDGSIINFRKSAQFLRLITLKNEKHLRILKFQYASNACINAFRF